MTFRFLHAADLHLDEPFEAVSASSPEVAAVLRDASIEAFDSLVRLAISRDVAFVVLAGGLYRGAAHGVRAQVELRRGLAELSERGIHTFIALGRDDPLDEGWTAVPDWPPLVTIFPSGEARWVSVERDGSVIATVHGVSQGSRGDEDHLPMLRRSDHPGVHIGVVRLDASTPDDISDAHAGIADAGLDYWAVGCRGGRAVRSTEPWVVCSGTVQARRAEPSAFGAQGAYLVEVGDSGVISTPELHPLDRVRFDRVEYGIDGVADLATLKDRLVDLGRARLAAADDRTVLVELELVGRGPVHGALHRPGALADLIDGLRVESLTDPPVLWWLSIELSTRGVRDLAELQGRNDFVADLVDEAAGLISDGDARGRRVEGWDDELPSDLAHLLGDRRPEPTAPDRWLRAQELAIELVAGDES